MKRAAWFIAPFLLIPQAQAKEPPDWQTFKANRVREAAPTNLLVPKLLPAVLDDARQKYRTWQEAWANHLENKEAAETLSSEPVSQGSLSSWGTIAGPYAIPTYIVMCESGGNYDAENAVSTASGAYQIVDGTWAGYGGYHHASDAPPAVQDAKAAELWAGGAGASHWASCL